MKTTKRVFFKVSVIAGVVVSSFVFLSATNPVVENKSEAKLFPIPSIYTKLHLKELGLNETAFQTAVTGWQKLKSKGGVSKNILSICDFTQSSNNKRLSIIDMVSG